MVAGGARIATGALTGLLIRRQCDLMVGVETNEDSQVHDGDRVDRRIVSDLVD